MTIWVDDVREPPEGYDVWYKTTDGVISCISNCIYMGVRIDLLDLDHDAGEYQDCGGDYIRILDWLEKQNISIPIRIHSMNPVGRLNMQRIITRNGWELVR